MYNGTMSILLAIWNDSDSIEEWPQFPPFVSAYSVFLTIRLQLYDQRLRGQADQRLSSAFGVCKIWLREHPAISISDFLDRLEHDPAFVYRIRNLGQVRRALILQYFKDHPL